MCLDIEKACLILTHIQLIAISIVLPKSIIENTIIIFYSVHSYFWSCTLLYFFKTSHSLNMFEQLSCILEGSLVTVKIILDY